MYLACLLIDTDHQHMDNPEVEKLKATILFKAVCQSVAAPATVNLATTLMEFPFKDATWTIHILIKHDGSAVITHRKENQFATTGENFCWVLDVHMDKAFLEANFTDQLVTLKITDVGKCPEGFDQNLVVRVLRGEKVEVPPPSPVSSPVNSNTGDAKADKKAEKKKLKENKKKEKEVEKLEKARQKEEKKKQKK